MTHPYYPLPWLIPVWLRPFDPVYAANTGRAHHPQHPSDYYHNDDYYCDDDDYSDDDDYYSTRHHQPFLQATVSSGSSHTSAQFSTRGFGSSMHAQPPQPANVGGNPSWIPSLPVRTSADPFATPQKSQKSSGRRTRTGDFDRTSIHHVGREDPLPSSHASRTSKPHTRRAQPKQKYVNELSDRELYLTSVFGPFKRFIGTPALNLTGDSEKASAKLSVWYEVISKFSRKLHDSSTNEFAPLHAEAAHYMPILQDSRKIRDFRQADVSVPVHIKSYLPSSYRSRTLFTEMSALASRISDQYPRYGSVTLLSFGTIHTMTPFPESGLDLIGARGLMRSLICQLVRGWYGRGNDSLRFQHGDPWISGNQHDHFNATHIMCGKIEVLCDIFEWLLHRLGAEKSKDVFCTVEDIHLLAKKFSNDEKVYEREHQDLLYVTGYLRRLFKKPIPGIRFRLMFVTCDDSIGLEQDKTWSKLMPKPSLKVGRPRDHSSQSSKNTTPEQQYEDSGKNKSKGNRRDGGPSRMEEPEDKDSRREESAQKQAGDHHFSGEERSHTHHQGSERPSKPRNHPEEGRSKEYPSQGESSHKEPRMPRKESRRTSEQRRDNIRKDSGYQPDPYRPDPRYQDSPNGHQGSRKMYEWPEDMHRSGHGGQSNGRGQSQDQKHPRMDGTQDPRRCTKDHIDDDSEEDNVRTRHKTPGYKMLFDIIDRYQICIGQAESQEATEITKEAKEQLDKCFTTTKFHEFVDSSQAALLHFWFEKGEGWSKRKTVKKTLQPILPTSSTIARTLIKGREKIGERVFVIRWVAGAHNLDLFGWDFEEERKRDSYKTDGTKFEQENYLTGPEGVLKSLITQLWLIIEKRMSEIKNKTALDIGDENAARVGQVLKNGSIDRLFDVFGMFLGVFGKLCEVWESGVHQAPTLLCVLDDLPGVCEKMPWRDPIDEDLETVHLGKFEKKSEDVTEKALQQGLQQIWSRLEAWAKIEESPINLKLFLTSYGESRAWGNWMPMKMEQLVEVRA